MAGGVAAAAAAGGMLALRALLNRKAWKREALGVATYGLVTLLSILGTPNVPSSPKASGLPEIVEAFFKILGWPGDRPASALLIQAPLILLAIVALRRRLSYSHPVWLILGLGLWNGLQAFIYAYGRGLLIAARYFDGFCLMVCTLLAASIMLPTLLPGRWQRLSANALLGIWLFYLLYGLFFTFTEQSYPQILTTSSQRKDFQGRISTYLLTHDENILSGNPIPAPSNSHLKAIMDAPSLAAELPPSIRPPLAWTVISNAEFVENGFDHSNLTPQSGDPIWGSFSQNGTKKPGEIQLSIAPANRTRWLRFYVAGYPRRAGISLALIDAHHHTQKLLLPGNPRNHWEPFDVKAPPGELTLRIKDSNPNLWVAVTAPREFGRLSALCEKIDDPTLTLLSLLGLTLLILPAFVSLPPVSPPEVENPAAA